MDEFIRERSMISQKVRASELEPASKSGDKLGTGNPFVNYTMPLGQNIFNKKNRV